MIFGDVKGFSKLREPETPVFLREVMGCLGAVIDRYDHSVLYRNTWGDGIFLVVDGPLAAAKCAMEMQAEMEALDLERLGLPSHLALRLGAHTGPVYEAFDPILGKPAYTGAHISKTARIEPVTPAGQVYVTEPFAAQIALEGGDRFSCEYVENIPAAKDFGLLRMYALKKKM